jgi:hypothetical protein
MDSNHVDVLDGFAILIGGSDSQQWHFVQLDIVPASIGLKGFENHHLFLSLVRSSSMDYSTALAV